MIRAAEVLEPSRILVENVPAIERDSTGVIEKARTILERLGYAVHTKIVSVADIGVPQLRKRHLLLATTERVASIDHAIATARINEPRSLRWAMFDLSAIVPERMIDTPSIMNTDNMRRARWLLRHGEYDLPNRLRPECHRDPAHKYKSMYGRLCWDEPAQTITTGFGSPGQGRYLHPVHPRTLTPHEAARIQFFPDWFSFRSACSRSALSDAIGNAVPVKLGFVVGVAALTSLARARIARKQMAAT